MKPSDIEKLIFCVNPGRSGSHYLSTLLSTVPGLCALHEPEHQVSRYSALKPSHWDLKATPLSSTREHRGRLKEEQIVHSCTAAHAIAYAETNPMFATLWHDAVFDRFSHADIVVIYLRRNPVDVVRSIYELGWYQMRDGDQWMVSQFSVNSLFPPLAHENETSAIEKIIAHVINVELYGRKILQLCQAQGASVIEIPSETMFAHAGQIADQLASVSVRINTASALDLASRNKEASKRKYAELSRDSCEQQLRDYLGRRPDLSGLLAL